ncbi:hypothetical protein J2W17_003669 [Pseudomonas lini]|uniref:hypothetical protein n=1 Tax=Pseudomonas lini TaxID=163011 RepID=UPI00278570A0|nr:hypothetical protein [Pseudomonas lini]MDQ0124715.1 hypothetical protein [Pseudomonas lini]
MDRVTIYPGAIPLETDLLGTNKNVMIALSKLSAAMLGTGTVANGFAVAPTGPASLQVVAAPGEIYNLQNVDGTAYSSIAADTTHQVVKQGIALDATTLSCPAPTTSGQSINYLVEVAYQDLDANPVVLPYYNASNPSQAYSGPGNNGVAQNTARRGTAAIQVKAGASATTGSQVTPSPDAGYIGLYVVTVAFGQTTITAGSINQYSGAPLLPSGLLQAIQTAATTGATDIGAANAYAANFTPAITQLSDKMVLCIKATNANTTASTFTPAPGVIAAAPIVGGNHAALQGGEIVPTGDVWLQWNSSVGAGSWILIDSTGGAMQVAPGTKSQHAAQIQQVGHGQCRLGIVNATSIKLSPCNGNNLVIAGVPRQIPAAGVTLTNGGMGINTLYYIYAYWTGSAIALEFSATGHSVDATTGIEIKTGDASRTLVGMVYVNGSAQFADGPAARLVASYFNRRTVGGNVTSSGVLSFSGTSNSEISTGVRILFLNWDNEAVDVKATGQYTNNTATQSVTIQAYVDAAPYGNISASYIPANGVGMAYASSNSLTPAGAYLTEGFHTASIYGSVTANTGSSTQLAHSIVTRI